MFTRPMSPVLFVTISLCGFLLVADKMSVAKEEEHNRCPQRHFSQFSDWSEPVNLGPLVNSGSDDFHPAISPNGLSLYITSGRPGGLGGSDIWVSQRARLDDPWGPPQNLGPNINSATNDIAPDFTPDGHWLLFSRGSALEGGRRSGFLTARTRMMISVGSRQ